MHRLARKSFRSISSYCFKRDEKIQFLLDVVQKNCLESDLNLEKEEILMLWEIEFQVLTSW